MTRRSGGDDHAAPHDLESGVGSVEGRGAVEVEVDRPAVLHAAGVEEELVDAADARDGHEGLDDVGAPESGPGREGRELVGIEESVVEGGPVEDLVDPLAAREHLGQGVEPDPWEMSSSRAEPISSRTPGSGSAVRPSSTEADTTTSWGVRILGGPKSWPRARQAFRRRDTADARSTSPGVPSGVTDTSRTPLGTSGVPRSSSLR